MGVSPAIFSCFDLLEMTSPKGYLKKVGTDVPPKSFCTFLLCYLDGSGSIRRVSVKRSLPPTLSNSDRCGVHKTGPYLPSGVWWLQLLPTSQANSNFADRTPQISGRPPVNSTFLYPLDRFLSWGMAKDVIFNSSRPLRKNDARCPHATLHKTLASQFSYCH